MDDRELQSLFADAPGEAPPAGFGLSDVTAASQRATARHRLRVATVSSAAALVLLGGGIFVALGPMSGDGGGSGEETALSAPKFDAQPPGQPQAGDARQDDGGSVNAEAAPSKQGDAADKPGRDATRTARCEQVDRQLAIALAGELPVVPDSEPIPGQFDCTPGMTQAAYRVDGEVISAALVTGRLNAPDLSAQPSHVQAFIDKGRLILVMSSAADGQSGAEDDLQEIADGVAERLG